MRASEMWTMGRKMLDDMGTVDKRAEKFLDPTPDEEATLRGLMRAARGASRSICLWAAWLKRSGFLPRCFIVI